MNFTGIEPKVVRCRTCGAEYPLSRFLMVPEGFTLSGFFDLVRCDACRTFYTSDKAMVVGNASGDRLLDLLSAAREDGYG